MAAVMAAGMTPPLGMALATAVRKKLLTEAERENGLACWLLGASFVTEGAIPFAAAHPLRVIPSCMVGSAVTGALVMGFGNELRAPHGGIFVLPLVSKPDPVPARDRRSARSITAVMVIVLMSLDKAKTEELAHEEDLAEGVAGLIGFHPARHGRGCDDVGRSPGCVSQLTLWLVRCARRPDRSPCGRQNKESQTWHPATLSSRPASACTPGPPRCSCRPSPHGLPVTIFFFFFFFFLLFVQAVTATGLPVTIAKSGGDPVDARSILMVMGLAVGNGEEVTLTAEGDGAEAALDQLAELLEIDHDAA